MSFVLGLHGVETGLHAGCKEDFFVFCCTSEGSTRQKLTRTGQVMSRLSLLGTHC